jgi:hypothetical protein
MVSRLCLDTGSCRGIGLTVNIRQLGLFSWGEVCMATIAQTVSRDERFYQKLALGLAIFIVFGFAQFAARGFVDYGGVPIIFHIHGLVMVSWLSVLVVQATFVARDNLPAHRKLGWIGAALATAIAPLAIATCVTAIRTGFAPPFFTPAYFLALVSIEGVVFAALVWAAIAMRRRTEWHRRLMIGAVIVLMEPALGRLLPMPLIGGENGEFLALAVQLGVLALIVRHDRATRGQVHPATLTFGAILIAVHLVVSIASRLPVVDALAASLSA